MKMIVRIAFLFLISPVALLAQYLPNSGQNFQYASLYNPAFSGIENFMDLKAGHRYQWTGFKDNAPQFTNLLVNFRVKQPLDLKVNALRPSRADFSKLVPRRKLSIQGLGFNLFHESVGPIKRTGLGTNYALHMPVSEKVFVSGGLGVMYEMTKLDGNDLYWGENPDPDPVYESLSQGAANHSEIWTRAGLLVYSETFYLGVTYYPFNTSLSTSDIVFNEQFYKGHFQAGFSFPLNEDFEMKPTIWALWLHNNKMAIDYAAKFYLQDRAWFGLTYRDIKAGIVSGGFNINELFSAGYSYEFPLGKLRTFGGGSHELVMGFRFNNFKNVNQRTW